MNDNNSSIENLSVENNKDKQDRSLSSKEWSLLTYIVRTYDVDTAIQIGQNINLKKRKENILNINFFEEYNKRSKISLSFLNTTQYLLSNNQWTLLSNIIHAYNTHSAIPIIQQILSKQSSYQPKLRFKLNHTLNIINYFFCSLNLFINEIISYIMIDQNCQEYIIKHNFYCIGCLNGLFIGRETYLLHNRVHSINFNIIFTENLMLITNRLIYQLEQNDILLKLFFVVLLFSTHLSIVSYNNFEEIKYENYSYQLNQYENIFIDLLWKYMLYKYDFQECIYRFSMMIKIVLDLLDQLYQSEELLKTRKLL